MDFRPFGIRLGRWPLVVTMVFLVLVVLSPLLGRIAVHWDFRHVGWDALVGLGTVILAAVTAFVARKTAELARQTKALAAETRDLAQATQALTQLNRLEVQSQSRPVLTMVSATIRRRQFDARI